MRPRQGYTLFELILVMALLVLLAAIAYPSIEAMYGNYRVTAAVDQVREGWAAAQAHAVDEGRAYRFAMTPDGKGYRVAPDGPDFSSVQGTANGQGDEQNQTYVLEETLPKGINLSVSLGGSIDQNGTSLPQSESAQNAGPSSVVFLPDGTAREDAQLLFQAAGSQPVRMTLRALTGIVTVKVIRPDRE
jgi:prepilin-type N-terminal cleavage/methylation domain-containing protein